MSDIVTARRWQELWANLSIFKDAIWVGRPGGRAAGRDRRPRRAAPDGVRVVGDRAGGRAGRRAVVLDPGGRRSVGPRRRPHRRARRARRAVAAVRTGVVGDRRVAARDAGVRRQPRAPAPDAREPARLRLPGQRRRRRHRRRSASRRRRTTWRRSCSAARWSCSPSIWYLVATATVILLGGHAVLWRALLFAGYDPMGARVQGMPVRALNVFLFLSVGLSVALCTRALGALPVFAFSVLPAMTALALTARIGLVFVLAALIGARLGRGRLRGVVPRRPARRRHADRHRGGPARRPRWSGASPAPATNAAAAPALTISSVARPVFRARRSLRSPRAAPQHA